MERGGAVAVQRGRPGAFQTPARSGGGERRLSSRSAKFPCPCAGLEPTPAVPVGPGSRVPALQIGYGNGRQRLCAGRGGGPTAIRKTRAGQRFLPAGENCSASSGRAGLAARRSAGDVPEAVSPLSISSCRAPCRGLGAGGGCGVGLCTAAAFRGVTLGAPVAQLR